MEATSQAVSIPVPEKDLLTQVLRQGAQKMLAQAIESEVAEWIDAHSQVRDEQGRRQVVRNGYLPERKIITLNRRDRGAAATGPRSSPGG